MGQYPWRRQATLIIIAAWKPFVNAFWQKKSENLSAKSQRGCLDNLAWGWYTSKVLTYAGVLELADETDSKSVGGDTVWVRPPSPAFLIPKPFNGLGIFFVADKADLFSDTLSSYTDDTVPVSRKSQYAKQFYRAPSETNLWCRNGTFAYALCILLCKS